MLDVRSVRTQKSDVAAWDADWSYHYLRRLMAKIQSRYALRTLADAPDVLASEDPVAFIRHDVDISLGRARILAELEKSWGIRSTYHVMLDCPVYDVTEARSREALRAIRACGHEIGLHYHPSHNESEAPPGSADAQISSACDRLAEALGTEVKSVSFHLPSPGLMGGPLRAAGRINAYAAPLLKWYLSDSRGRWREGEPMFTLDAPRSNHLQILVHPLWWGERHESPGVRLTGLVKEVAQQRGASFEEIAELIEKHILVPPIANGA